MVIGIDLEDGAFEQDVRELLMAFYPGAEFVYKEQLTKANRVVEGRFLNDGKNLPCRYFLRVQKTETGEENCGGSNGQAVFLGVSPVMERGLKEAQENRPFAIDWDDHKETKNRIKRRLYFLLMLDTGKELPWGALTGIRPVKIPEAKLQEGWSDEQILPFLEENYLVGEKKRRLSLEIAKEERALLSRLDYQKGYSLYIGIPFCPTTCLYCSFTSYPIGKWSSHLEKYLNCLEQELLLVKEWTKKERKLQTIYIGGGTPTSLPEEFLRRLMEIVSRIFSLGEVNEFTVEAGRPDSLNREKLRILKEYSVGRISINPQSMNQKTLDLIGRRHSAKQVKDVYFMAREEGFSNINMDIILGLPGELEEEIQHTLKEIKAMGPESLTVHCLALKRAARLNLEKQQYADYPMASGKMIDRLVDLAAQEAEEMGMKPYYLYRQKNMAGNLENVGYAASGKACLYNILMMEEKQSIIACGAGSVSKRVYPDGRIERSENVKDVSQYIERIGEMIERKKHILSDC